MTTAVHGSRVEGWRAVHAVLDRLRAALVAHNEVIAFHAAEGAADDVARALRIAHDPMYARRVAEGRIDVAAVVGSVVASVADDLVALARLDAEGLWGCGVPASIAAHVPELVAEVVRDLAARRGFEDSDPEGTSTSSGSPPWRRGRVRIVVLGPGEERYLRRLLDHLMPLCGPGGIADGWTPTAAFGAQVDQALAARLDTADVAVVLAGPTTPVALVDAILARRPRLRVLPVFGRAFDWSLSRLARLGQLPTSGPVASYPMQDVAFTEVARGVYVAAVEVLVQRTTGQDPSEVDVASVRTEDAGTRARRVAGDLDVPECFDPFGHWSRSCACY